MPNLLQYETSPYLLQHADNPVNWYPWCSEAFRRAKEEDKPIFLSIGYSTCHWCHVMAHECFEDEEVAQLLNAHFISIKVDKEERMDIDNIYMNVCQAFTGSGGWPTTVFLTPEQKPFYAGCYFPKHSHGSSVGLCELLHVIQDKWKNHRKTLLQRAEEILQQLKTELGHASFSSGTLIENALQQLKRSYDESWGGFGNSMKFPQPHKLLFLMSYYERYHDSHALAMAERSLQQMHRGGLFDHIGFGFCRYSTDRKFLVPHFEKMLYDNALLILAYAKAYELTKKEDYLSIAKKTASYVLREMSDPKGGYYSAQDADSNGQEGCYYLFTPEEIRHVLGTKDGKAFNRYYDITSEGNFEGKNIPNLLYSDPESTSFDHMLPALYQYRKKRFSLHRDDKILTSWNALMIAAMCRLYHASGEKRYLWEARRADGFIQDKLFENGKLFTSWCKGKRGASAFLDDYAAYIYAQLALYTASLEECYLLRAEKLCRYVLAAFADKTEGGFFLSGEDNEPLILRSKESFDGAVPSGNSLMAWVLVRLSQLREDDELAAYAKAQQEFLCRQAGEDPSEHCMFLLSLLDEEMPPDKLTAVLAHPSQRHSLPLLPADVLLKILEKEDANYPLIGGLTTFYLCRGQSCFPPVNDLSEYF